MALQVQFNLHTTLNVMAERSRLTAQNVGEELPPLSRYYHELQRQLGEQGWWPARTAFEVIVGAILVQNTAWVNVERALVNLRQLGPLTPRAISRANTSKLEKLIRPSGYFRRKARKLKAFVKFLNEEYSGSLARMFRTPTGALREKLLRVHGIGPETADSILLYAGGHPIFVVDAYTRRILARHGWATEKSGYGEIQALFERALPRDAAFFNEFHALLVNVGKNWCRPRAADCERCPLGALRREGL